MNIELYEEICEAFGDEAEWYLEDTEVVVNNIKYGAVEVESLTTEDEGKYQIGGTIYGIGKIEDNKIEEILFYIEQDFTQTGSYYSDQEKEYEIPYIVKKVQRIVEVWESI